MDIDELEGSGEDHQDGQGWSMVRTEQGIIQPGEGKALGACAAAGWCL